MKASFAFLERDRIDHRLALHAFESGLDHREFRRIDHHRHAGDVGLGGDQIEERDHRLFGIEQALVHIDVDDLRAVLDLVARHRERGRIIAGGDELAEAGRAGDVGALADIDEGNLRRQRKSLEPGEPQPRRDFGDGARRLAGDGAGDGADVLRRRAAAAADDIDQAGRGEFADQLRHHVRPFVVAAEFVGQAGIGIGADQGVGDAGELGDMRAHFLGAERAIEPERQRRGMRDRVPERFRRLAGQQAAGAVGDGAGNHHRHGDAPRFELVGDGENRRLGVERVEDGFDQQRIDAAGQKPAHLLGISKPQLVEGDGAKAGIGDVRRDRSGAVGRTERAGDETLAAVLVLPRAAPPRGRAARLRRSVHRRSPPCRNRPARCGSRKRYWSRRCRRRRGNIRDGWRAPRPGG